MRRIASLAPVLPAPILGFGQWVQSQDAEGDIFIEKPYLQLGDAPGIPVHRIYSAELIRLSPGDSSN